MESIDFRFNSHRAAKARLAHRLGGIWRQILIALTILLAFGGALLLMGGLPIGWLMLGLAAFPAMIETWYSGELKALRPIVPAKSIDDVLSADILGQLPASPTPQDIAAAIGQTSGGLFFAVRFGITPRFLQNIAEGDTSQTEGIWQEARRLQEQTGSIEITGSILLLALIRVFPSYETLLAQLHLHEDDVLYGIKWRQHVVESVDHFYYPHRTGGIARDWAFGYIPTLSRLGQNISEQITTGGLLTVELQSHSSVLEQIIHTFSTGGRQNVALVGTQGSGKSSIIHSFAAHLLDASTPLPDSLKFRQVFVLSAASLLSTAPGRGELEGLIAQIIDEACSAKNIIICLEDAELFFEDGTGSVDLTKVLLPILEAGRLRIILTMDEQRYLELSSSNPALANTLNRINVEPASEGDTLAIMQDHLITVEFADDVTYTYQALVEAYRLSERYIYDLAQPGRAIRLLELSAGYAEDGLVTINSVQQAIEKTLGVKTGIADPGAERDTLLNLEDLIHGRMINQTRAVKVVSDALRRARAGVRNQNRPIGTFLFLGPTGVGKTELAKALAEIYFNGEDNLIRLDLNEFVRVDDVARLIADGAEDQASLTAQVMKRPFSVILLDEIEKAHPAVLTTLLQMLDEGILRDIKNREVSFRDAIIIATSNAGAERIREYIDRGYKLEQFEEKLTDELISSNQFRPEFLNRFDEIVIFKPLEKAELMQVIDLILAGVNKTLAPQKVSVEVESGTKEYLVEKGYDPRLGARPLRRVVQRAVENTVAKRMLAGDIAPGGVVTLTLAQVTEAIEA